MTRYTQVALAAAFALTAGVAKADHHDLGTCFEDAAIASVAASSGVDRTTARQMAAILPEGQQMLGNMRSMSHQIATARRDGVQRELLLVVLRGSMQDSPSLAVGVETCINRYY
ncbi:hypothetical protein [Jannaschia marina]|uniref:hypothetical protein n=1 Tax=Jannaschia marina TaxID=2741674 RepID=UPI0015CE7944|nr:hypothetical protein [Jannaschia marina]